MIKKCCPSVSNNTGVLSGGESRVNVINTDENLYIPMNAYDNQIFWLPLNENYLDSSQNHLDGTNFNSSFDMGVFCLTSVYTSGVDYIEIEPDILLDDYPFSFSCWCRFDSLPKAQGMCLWSDGRIEFGIDFRGIVDVITINRQTNLAIKENFANGNVRLVSNTWYYLAFSYYKGKVKIYVNGTLQTTKTFNEYLLGDVGNSYIGRSTGGKFWQGNIQSAHLTGYMPDEYFQFAFKNICDYENTVSYGVELPVEGDVFVLVDSELL